MVALWNAKELSLPPVCTYKANSFTDIDIEKFHTLCRDFLDFLIKYPHLHSESILLSRIVYRMKQKFRTSKDFKALEKLTKSLQRYFSMNLSSDLQTLKELIPENCSDELYLPSKNLVEYVLVRLQGVAKLIEYIIETSTDIAYMLTIRIHTGHFWKIGFILFSIVSRVYVLSRHIIKAVCDFYSQLLPISKKLVNVGKIWLQENYIFPENLEAWLDIDLLKLDQDFKKLNESSSVPNILHYFSLVDDIDSDIEVSDQYVLVNEIDNVNSSTSEINQTATTYQTEMLSGFTLGEDIGEIIEIMSDGNEFNDAINIFQKKKRNIGQKQNHPKLKKTFSLQKIKKKKKKKSSTK